MSPKSTGLEEAIAAGIALSIVGVILVVKLAFWGFILFLAWKLVSHFVGVGA